MHEKLKKYSTKTDKTGKEEGDEERNLVIPFVESHQQSRSLSFLL